MHTCESVRACADLPSVPSGGYPFDEVALLSEDGTTTHPLSETVSSDVCTAGRIAGNVYRGTRKLLGLLNIGDFFLAETALVIHTHTHEREREREKRMGLRNIGDLLLADMALVVCVCVCVCVCVRARARACVCVCACTNTHTHSHAHTHMIYRCGARTATRSTSIPSGSTASSCVDWG